jgi:hypothetical protein
MLFDELMQSKKMEDPEIRKAADIGRSETKVKSKRGRKTSVSVGTFKNSMLIVGIVFSVAAISAIVYGAWKVIELYIGG